MTLSASFQILAGSEPIGSSEFEHRDPPMGVAFGRSTPTPAYANVRERVRATARVRGRVAAQLSLELKVRSKSGVIFDPRGCISICDISDEMNPDDIEVEILGFSEFSQYFSVPPDA
jgi:hypothetical protein